MDHPDARPDADRASASPARGRWWLGVVPVVAVVVVVLAVAAALLPSVRRQLDLSVTRQPESYVELFFPRTAAGTSAVCERTGRQVRVDFVVVSHLAGKRDVAYEVRLTPDSAAQPQQVSGSVATSPREDATASASFVVPRRAGYTVEVLLPGRQERLRANCPGATR